MRQNKLSAQDVRAVVVRLAASSIRTVDDREMPDISLQYMVAVMLLDRTASFRAAHDKARMNDPAILEQTKKNHGRRGSALQALLPQRVAIVEVTLTDGRTMSNRVETVRGTAGNPMTSEEVVEKARDLVGPVLGANGTERLFASVMALESQGDVRAIGGMPLTGAGGSLMTTASKIRGHFRWDRNPKRRFLPAYRYIFGRCCHRSPRSLQHQSVLRA